MLSHHSPSIKADSYSIHFDNLSNSFVYYFIHAEFTIIIMIIKAIKTYQTCITKNYFRFCKINIANYTPPPSQFEQFKKHLENISDKESRTKAADLMSKLQNDQQIYREKLIQMNKEIEYEISDNPKIMDIIDKRNRIQAQIQDQMTENRLIDTRFSKEFDNVKIYGITKIAKEIIEVADHLKQAIKILEGVNNPEKITELTKIRRIHQELQRVFHKYEIREFVPLNEYFDPNQQESIGTIPSQDLSKKNTVAEVKRSGYKIKQRLLRSAYVIIYK